MAPQARSQITVLRLRTLLLVSLATLLVTACSSGASNQPSSVENQPVDPRTAPTATLPAVLSSPVPAGATGTATVSNLPASYTVKSGDTLSAIAAKYGVSLQDLLSYNSGVSANSIRIGQELQIPPANSATPLANPTGTPGAGASPSATRAPATRTIASSLASSTPRPSATLSSATRTPVARSSATAAATRAATSATAGQNYTVKSGDTACGIASNAHVSLQALAQANGTTVSALASLKVGQQLKIPASSGAAASC